jgi:uncharacterized protein (TIGR02996 family)
MNTTKEVSTFTRRGCEAMPGLQSFASSIAEEPTDALRWLVMADWLSENGCEKEASLVRSLFSNETPPAEGTISRGYYQWENGGQHWCGVHVEYRNGEWLNCYWANGNWADKITRQQAWEIITAKGRPWRSERRERWTGEVTVVEGVNQYTGLMIRA